MSNESLYRWLQSQARHDWAQAALVRWDALLERGEEPWQALQPECDAGNIWSVRTSIVGRGRRRKMAHRVRCLSGPGHHRPACATEGYRLHHAWLTRIAVRPLRLSIVLAETGAQTVCLHCARITHMARDEERG